MTDQLQALFDYCQLNGRVCPQPMKWDELYKLLPYKKRDGFGWVPPIPLILAAWHETSAKDKRSRLREHLVYAADRGAIDIVDAFLRGLSDKDWFHDPQ